MRFDSRMRSWTLAFLTLQGLGLVVLTNVVAQEGASELPRKIIAALDDTVLPAYQAQDIDGFLISMAAVLEKLNTAQYALLEDYGKTKEIPSLRGAFTQLVLDSIEQGRRIKIDLSSPDVAMFLLSGIRDRVNADLSEINSSPEMASEVRLPVEWPEREKLLWNIHVFRNRFLNLTNLAGFAKVSANQQLKRRRNANDAQRVELLNQFVQLEQDVHNAFAKLLNNEAMLRLDELYIAERILRDTSDFAERLYAAYALEDDGRSLLEFLSSMPAEEIAFPRLSNDELPGEIKQLLASGRQHGKDVIEKALCLRTGTHWWLRGRYGAGPLNEGLLKSPDAMESADAMTGLYMPKLPNKPISKYLGLEQVTPGYERRHYYVWAIERRDLQLVSGSHRSTHKANARLTGDTFW